MRCNEFHRRLADWTLDRLPADSDELMTLHAADCRSCAEEAEIERSLRASFRTVAPITRTPDLWERIESRVETTRRPRFAFRFQRTLALSGAMAAGLMIAYVAVPRPPSITPPTNPAIARAVEPGVLEQINTIRMTETDPTAAYSDVQDSAQAAHLLLVGGPGR
jgi:hypothetical protein